MALRGARTTPLAILLCVALFEPTMATAQQQEDGAGRGWFASLSRVGKWITLASAAGFTTAAALKRGDAEDHFDILVGRCRATPQSCQLSQTGEYADLTAESLFQETLVLDRHAQRYLIAGQLSLVVSGTMFLVDLVTDREGPGDIPFVPLELYSDNNRIGLRLEF
ncbi:MAG: hypothetical protein ACE5FJ_09710 [Gemmatimonadales bacterium]